MLSPLPEHTKHLPVSRCKVSPTAIGWISGGRPSFCLLKAVRLPPAKNLDTDEGGDAKRLTISLLEEMSKSMFVRGC